MVNGWKMKSPLGMGHFQAKKPKDAEEDLFGVLSV